VIWIPEGDSLLITVYEGDVGPPEWKRMFLVDQDGRAFTDS